MVIKLSDEQAAKLGITKDTDFGAFLETLTARVTGLEDSTKTFSTAAAVKVIENGLEANTATLGALITKVEKFPVALTADEIKTMASEAASLTAATALGVASLHPIKANPTESSAEQKKDFAAIVASYVASGKSKGEAIRLAVQSNPTEYAEAKAKGIANL